MTPPRKPVPDDGDDNLKRNPLTVVPCLYKAAHPGADYGRSLRLLADVKAAHPHLPTKSGLMAGLGENRDEIIAVMRDLRAHGWDLPTIGQSLQPGGAHLAVERYVYPDEFEEFARIGHALGFRHVASGPLVRSSHHAEHQAHAL